MSIKIKLFGELKKEDNEIAKDNGEPSILHIDGETDLKVSDILKKLQIPESKVSHIFVNGIFSALTKLVKSGDQVAFFPRNMGLLYKWYFKKDT
jgi:molybdopterin converting factor small subunit